MPIRNIILCDTFYPIMVFPIAVLDIFQSVACMHLWCTLPHPNPHAQEASVEAHRTSYPHLRHGENGDTFSMWIRGPTWKIKNSSFNRSSVPSWNVLGGHILLPFYYFIIWLLFWGEFTLFLGSYVHLRSRLEHLQEQSLDFQVKQEYSKTTKQNG
jgi:hypothetical protein